LRCRVFAFMVRPLSRELFDTSEQGPNCEENSERRIMKGQPGEDKANRYMARV
jgi:hypothetical protein